LRTDRIPRSGKRADLIGIDFSSSPHAIALHDATSQIVHCARPSDVKLVIVEGEILMERGIMKKIDEQKILKDGQKAGVGLVKRMGD
jgi:5-methylthioadenosine/S-adenosylhomocysteine deaminase